MWEKGETLFVEDGQSGGAWGGPGPGGGAGREAGRWRLSGACGGGGGPVRGGGSRRDSWQTATAKAAPKARARAEEDSDASSDDDDMGDARADDTKAYQEKVGRYRSHVGSVLKGAEAELWLLAQANTQARSPWDNFFLWIQKCKGARQGTDPGVVAQLVLGQADRFSQSFENLLGPQAWADFLDACPLH